MEFFAILFDLWIALSYLTVCTWECASMWQSWNNNTFLNSECKHSPSWNEAAELIKNAIHQSLGLLPSLGINCLGHAKPKPTTKLLRVHVLIPGFGWLQDFVAISQTPKWHFLMVDVFRLGVFRSEWQRWCKVWGLHSRRLQLEPRASSACWQTGAAPPAWALLFPSGEWELTCDSGPCAQQPQLRLCSYSGIQHPTGTSTHTEEIRAADFFHLR